MFNQNQIEVLNSQLDSSRVKTREKGNINLSYLEGFDIIETANSIFGYGNWDYAISKLELVSQELNQNDNTVICYRAIVQVLVHSENHSQDVSREDVGFGTGVSKSLADAHENAGKEAVTDALKRAMRSFGNQFGNSLYDKSRNQNHNNPNIAPTQNYQSSNNQQNRTQKPLQNQQQAYQNTNVNNNRSSANVNQNHQQNNPQQQQPYQNQNNQSFDQYEYQGLYNLGLDLIEQNGFLVVTGENQYAYKDAIKACGFRFDSKSKSWYKQLEQRAS